MPTVTLIAGCHAESFASELVRQGFPTTLVPETAIYRLGPPDRSVPLPPADLYWIIGEHGDASRLPPQARPLVTWAIDPHFEPGLTWALGNARLADLAFVSQEPAVADFARAGVPAQWLPLAWDPRHIYPRPEIEVYDACFVGALGTPERQRLAALLPRRCPASYVGEAWGDDLIRLYNQTRVVLNSSMHVTYRNINPRVLHVLGAGRCLLTDECAGLTRLFREEVEIVVYRSEEELWRKLDWLLRNPEARRAIAAAGHQRAAAEHTVARRVATVLQECRRKGLV